ncbi:MAG: T9SS type A sorting domain-containing protein [Salibacteraceae bacterium]|nr:T9SS type A sorting domain-containing protein [Salibacteraceae bacterium]|tara:strand:+ start:50474 stop:52261 length:1788 start_codon:yes stop_codon:yes gene_type:complete
MKSKLTFTIILTCLLLCTSLLYAQDPCNPDINGDGTLDILVIGTSKSIKDGTEAFSPQQITKELKNILSADTSISINVNVVSEDIYKNKTVTTGIADQITSNLDYYCHSLNQYYYWPDAHEDRMNNLKGNNGVDWDLVVIGADPYIVSTIPGYYALGVNKIAAKVIEGGAKPLLLMLWPKDETMIDHFEEFTYRTADGAKVPLPIVPAGLAWKAIPTDKKDNAIIHPTPNGAYLTAAAIYSHIYGNSASSSDYSYDDEIADIAHATQVTEMSQVHYVGKRSFISPYKSCEISDQTLIYNHGGTSTEYGILDGLNWVVAEDQKTLQFGSTPPIHFNYGRSSMGSTHLYKIDPSKYDYSFGYPLQDDASTGKVSMLYGLDKRVSENDVETDLGVALNMVRKSELPYGRNVPIRTLIAQMLEEIPGVDIHSDSWHLSNDVNKAIGTYMYTLLSSDCALAGDSMPTDSAQWRSWMAHKIGYETAWNLMYQEGITPCFMSTKDTITPCVKDTSTTTSITPIISDQFLVYPNPTNGSFTIDLGGNNEAITVTLTDLSGRIIQVQNFIESSKLDLKIEEPAGVYLLMVELEGKKAVMRLIKE